MMNLNSIQFLVFTAINVASFILFLRLWFQYSRVDFYNPISQSLVKFTNPVLTPLQKVLPTVKNVNLAALAVVLLLGVVKYPLVALVPGDVVIEASIPAYLLVGGLHTLRTIGETWLYILFIGAIMSWFNRGHNPTYYLLHQLGEPLLNPIRRFLPNTGMIDFSPMLLAFILFYGNRVMYDLCGVFWALA